MSAYLSVHVSILKLAGQVYCKKTMKRVRRVLRTNALGSIVERRMIIVLYNTADHISYMHISILKRYM